VGGGKKSNKKDRIEGEKTMNATHIYNLQKSSTKIIINSSNKS